MSKTRANLILIFLLTGLASLSGVSTSEIRQGTYNDFVEGEWDNLSLSNLGVLRPGPALEEVAKLEADVIFDMVEASDGTLYVATGNQGKVFKIPAGGEPELFFKSRELLVRALALGPDGALYVGSSPHGRVYRVTEGARPEIYFEPGEVYIWDMLFDQEGSLYVATGAKACIYKVPPDFEPGLEAETWFSSDRTHFSALAFDEQGNLLAGSGPKAYLYRITGKDEGEVLFNAGTDEIAALLPEPDGSVVFATLHRKAGTGSDGKATPMDLPAILERLQTPGRTTGNSGGGNAGGGSGGSSGGRSEASSPSGPAAAPSLLFRLGTDGFVEPLWSPGSGNILSLQSLEDGTFLIGTDDKARIFRVSGRSDWELSATPASGGEISFLLPSHAGNILVAASNPAVIYRMTDEAEYRGAVYTSKALDAQAVARWGRLLAVGAVPGQTAGISWETRTGNAPEPDDTWSSWEALDEGRIASPPGRYLQYRAAFDEADAMLREVRAFYLWRNAAPVVTRINVIPVGLQIITVAVPNKPPVNLAQLTGSRELPSDVTDGPPVRTQVRYTGDQGYVSYAWSVFDPNGDRLRFRVDLRQEGSEDWLTMVSDLEDTLFSMNTRGMEDGYYRVRVTATDAPSNAPGEALSGHLISQLFLIDNTPPQVRLVTREVADGRVELVFEASDAYSVIKNATYVLNGKPEVMVFPEDGLFDSTQESFRIVLEGLPSGPHTVLFQAGDESGNIGTAQAVFSE